MKKILSLAVAVLSFCAVVAAQLNYIDFTLTAGDDAGVATPFNYARIVSTTTDSGTTYNTIVFGAGNTVARVAADDSGTLLLTSDQVTALTAATASTGAKFYFEFFNDSVITGYSDYITASDLAGSISKIDTTAMTFSVGNTLVLTGYAAPEPNSVLLLLLGGALLGLRRRRKM